MKELLDILGGIMDAALALWIGTVFAMWQIVARNVGRRLWK